MTKRKSFIPKRSDIFVKKPPKITLDAWTPYSECVSILFELQNSDLDDDHPEWRISWIAGIALLRAIGHVLDKVDSIKSAKHKKAIARLWSSWKSDKSTNWIFWDFIEQERNNILKIFKFGVEIDEQGLFHRGLGEDGG
jgi:hypothetical protein